MSDISLKSPDLPAQVDLANLQLLEAKFLNLLQNLAFSNSAVGSFTIDPEQQDRAGKKFNRYIVAHGAQSIKVDFRTFNVQELPKSFRKAGLDTPAARSMVATLKTMVGMHDMVAAVLTGLNELLKQNFHKDSLVYYALQNARENLHAFFYQEAGSERRVVVMIQL